MWAFVGREEQVMRFQNMEKTTPSETVANDKAIQHDPSTPSISPLASQIRDVNVSESTLSEISLNPTRVYHQECLHSPILAEFIRS